MEKLHDFHERLEMSQRASDEPFWLEVYRKAFVGYVGCLPVLGDSPAQRMGIDRFVILSSGQELRIDEKKREEVWPDILLEYLSNDQTNAPGWMEKDLHIDYIAYAFMPAKRVHLYPWHLLRRAWIQHGATWKKEYKLIPAPNPGYKTWSVAVPIAVLDKAVQEASVIQLGSVASLTKPPAWEQAKITEFYTEVRQAGYRTVEDTPKILGGKKLTEYTPEEAWAKLKEFQNKAA
jgi:hypothetical protein